jgi:hypothetical protein
MSRRMPRREAPRMPDDSPMIGVTVSQPRRHPRWDRSNPRDSGATSSRSGAGSADRARRRRGRPAGCRSAR